MKVVWLFWCSIVVHGLDLDNLVKKRPEVQCGLDNIVVNIETLRPFGGRLYVQGESENEECIKTAAADDYSTQAAFRLPIGACNMRRQRTMQPRGVSFSFTLVVSFHHFFVTGMDRAFHIRCFFLESVKSLHTEYGVGILKTEIVQQEYQPPECVYRLYDGTSGQSLQYAQVGQRVKHTWTCDEGPSFIYGFLIHSCYVDDGQGNKFELVDDQGCSTDTYLLPNIQYDASKLTASTNAQVFKYADKIQLYFTCTVQLCYQHDGGCEGVTVAFILFPNFGISMNEPHFNQAPNITLTLNFYFATLVGIGFLLLVVPTKAEDGATPKRQVLISSTPTTPPSCSSQGSSEKQHDEIDDEDDDSSDPNKSKPFFGPIHSDYDRTKYRDSPLNKTMPIDHALILTNRSQLVKKPTKRRRDLNMETDLSVDVIVLPFDDKTVTGGTLRVPNVCFSRTASTLLLVAFLLTTALSGSVAFIIARQSSNYKGNVDAFH